MDIYMYMDNTQATNPIDASKSLTIGKQEV
jgi:hypothetical protein